MADGGRGLSLSILVQNVKVTLVRFGYSFSDPQIVQALQMCSMDENSAIQLLTGFPVTPPVNMHHGYPSNNLGNWPTAANSLPPRYFYSPMAPMAPVEVPLPQQSSRQFLGSNNLMPDSRALPQLYSSQHEMYSSPQYQGPFFPSASTSSDTGFYNSSNPQVLSSGIGKVPLPQQSSSQISGFGNLMPDFRALPQLSSSQHEMYSSPQHQGPSFSSASTCSSTGCYNSSNPQVLFSVPISSSGIGNTHVSRNISDDISVTEFVQAACNGTFAKRFKLFTGTRVVGSKRKGLKCNVPPHRGQARLLLAA